MWHRSKYTTSVYVRRTYLTRDFTHQHTDKFVKISACNITTWWYLFLWLTFHQETSRHLPTAKKMKRNILYQGRILDFHLGVANDHVRLTRSPCTRVVQVPFKGPGSSMGFRCSSAIWTLKHKDSFGKSENLSKIFFAENSSIWSSDYEGKSSSSNGLLWISFI